MEIDNFGPWMLVEKKKHVNRRVNFTSAQISISGQRSPMANTVTPLFSPTFLDPELPGFEKSEGKLKMGFSCTMNGSNVGQKENNKSTVKPNFTAVTKVRKGPHRGQKSKILSRGPSGSKGSKQNPNTINQKNMWKLLL